MHYTANGNFVNEQVRENFETIKNRKNIERFEDVSSEAMSSNAVKEVAKLIASALAPESTASREPELTNEQTYEYGGKIYIVGRQGPKGDQGAIGLTGPQGNPGVKGDQGEIGGQGIKGDQGPAGAAGQPGIKGDKGDQGVQGPQGIPGNKGDQGPMGPTGPPFDTTLIQSEVCQFYNNLAGQFPDKALYQPNFCLKLSTGNTGPLINSVPAPPAFAVAPQSVKSVGGAVSEVSSHSAPFASEGFRNVNREDFQKTGHVAGCPPGQNKMKDSHNVMRCVSPSPTHSMSMNHEDFGTFQKTESVAYCPPGQIKMKDSDNVTKCFSPLDNYGNCPPGKTMKMHDGVNKCFNPPTPVMIREGFLGSMPPGAIMPSPPCPPAYGLATKTARAGYCMPLKPGTVASVNGVCPPTHRVGSDGSMCYPIDINPI